MIINIEQGTPEWHAWRFTGIGGSDAPALFGKSPYKTKFQLAKEKIGKLELADDSKEFIFRQGHKSEKIARQAFEELTGEPSKPVCMADDKDSQLIISLDGFNSTYGLFEAKLVGKDVLEHAAKTGEIPEHHKIQMHHGFNISQVDRGQWYGRDTQGNGVLLEIKKEKKLALQIRDEALAFWDQVQKGILPPLSDEDYLEPDDITLLLELREAKEFAENAEIEYERIKKAVLDKYNHAKISGAGLKVFKSQKAGSISWDKIPEVAKVIERIKTKKKGAYAESFRGKGSVSWTVKFDTVKKGGADE